MQSVVVSGGSRGIGRAIVENLALGGFHVHFLYRNRDDAAAEVVNAVAKKGGLATPHRCDVTDRDSLNAFCESIADENIYGLVNNAAALRDGHFLLMDKDNWDIVVATGLTAVYGLTRGCLRPMLHQGIGRIVNIGSLSGLLGKAGQVNYSSVKGGVHAFSKALAREVGRYGVTVNTVVPGWISTDILTSLSAARREKALQEIPLGRFGQPGDVARVVSFLMAKESSYVTGAMIRVDGGIAY